MDRNSVLNSLDDFAEQPIEKNLSNAQDSLSIDHEFAQAPRSERSVEVRFVEFKEREKLQYATNPFMRANLISR